MIRKIVLGVGLVGLSAIAGQAQVMTDSNAAGVQPMPQASAGPGAGQSYFEGNGQCDAQCNAGCNDCRQCDDCCRYLKSFGGWTSLDDYENTNGPFETTGSFEDGYCVGGALGRKLRPMLNAEVEFAYRQNDGEEWSVFNPQTQTTQTQPWDGEITCYSGMTNFIVEACRQNGRINPYAGAGAGFGFVDAELSTQTATYTIDDAGFAFQFIAGLSKAVTCRADVFVEYRYFAVEDLVVDIQSQTAPPADGDFDYRTQNVLFGIRLCH